MGRFSGGKASWRDSWSEINIKALAAAIAAITNSPCHHDRDSFGTISRIDITGSEMRGQTLLICDLSHDQGLENEPQIPRTEKFSNPRRVRGASQQVATKN